MLTDDLTGFMARTDMPVPIQAALAHAQSENIHPFADGNGRTAGHWCTPSSGTGA
jgi:Fic family protein